MRPCMPALLLALALALATCSEAAGGPRSPPQDAPSGPGARRAPEAAPWLDRLGRAPQHQRQLRFPGPPHPVEELAKKQGPWVEEEEEAYGWMDFGRRSAEDGDRQP